MSLTFKQLEAFLAVAQTLSFSRAAAMVHLSQPALSANIQRLEQVVGARLFDRDTRTVALTAAGKEFAGIATSLKSHTEQGLARMHDFADGKVGYLDIAVAPLVAASSLPQILVKYRGAYPNIKLRIYDELSSVCEEMVRSGVADVAIMPERGRDSALTQQILFRDPLVVLCAPNHPLVQTKSVEWGDVVTFDLIVRGSDSSVRQLLETHYLRQGVLLQPAYEVNHIGTLLSLIAAGLGIGVVPYSLVSTVKMVGLTYRPFKKGTESYWVICVSTPTIRSGSPAAQFFVDVCVEHFAG